MFAFGFAQNESSVYEIYQTEFYIYNKNSETYELETRNRDVSIQMVFCKDAINIQAKTPTLFKVKTESKKFFQGEGYRGYRFDAFECVEEKTCKVDYVFNESDKTKFMLSVTFEDETLGGVNLRYYSTLHK